MCLSELETRVARLERQNRLLLLGCLGLAGLPFLLGAGQAVINVDKPITGQLGQVQPPVGAATVVSRDLRELLRQSNAIQPILKTRALALVDANGKVRATLSTDDSSYPSLAFYDSHGALRSEWRLSRFGALLQAIQYSTERPTMRLGFIPRTTDTATSVFELFGTADVQIGGQPGSERIRLQADLDRTELAMANGFRERLRLIADNDKSELSISNRNAAVVSLVGRTGSALTMGCDQVQPSGALQTFLNMKQYRADSTLRLTVHSDGADVAATLPGSKYGAWFGCQDEKGGNIRSRERQGPGTDQVFMAHSYQSFSPTRSAHLKEVKPGDP